MSSLTPEEVGLLQEAEEYEDRKSLWLLENHYSEKDIMLDEDGEEFVIDISDNGNPQEEGYGIKSRRIYLNQVIFEDVK